MDRRHFLGAGGAALGLGLTAGCGGFSTSGSGSGSGRGEADTLAFTTWGTDAELAGFRSAIDRFQAANSGVTVNLNAVPYEQMFTNIDAQLQAGNPPDVFRVPYYLFGGYAGRGQLLDLAPHLGADIAARFTPQAWAAVQNAGKPFGVPHHTDTSVILYNTEALRTAGIDAVPTSADDAWTWDQLGDVARTLRRELPDDKFPFAYNWQGNGVTRWLSWLFQADGRFLDEDLVTPAIDSDAGRAALEWTSRFFGQQWVPANNSVKSTTLAADTWYAQTCAMVWGGAFLVPDADANLDFEWGATLAPRKLRAGGDFGGNALVATAATQRAELAASFLLSLTEADPMREFCASASLLPTRQDLVDGGIKFSVRPDLSPVFVGQAAVVQAQDAGQVASPSMTGIITVLKDELEEAFVGGQSVEDTVSRLSDRIAAATAR